MRTVKNSSQPARLAKGVLVAFVLNALVATAASADVFPSRPIRVVVPYSAGNGPDAVIRHVGEKISGSLGAAFVVDNKPGASGWLAIGDVRRSPADGYTLLAVDSTHFSLQPSLYKKLPFDPDKDFVPVAPLYVTNFFIVVGAKSPYRSLQELMAAAKSADGRITYGSWGVGSVAHVGGAMLESASDTRMTHVPFKEVPMLYNAVATGEVDWAFGSAATVAPLYKAGKVRLIAYAAPHRLAAYPGVPTVQEAGGPTAFELRSWLALVARRGTPQSIVDTLNVNVGKALADAAVRERLSNFGFELWSASPVSVTQAMESDSRRYSDIVKKIHISLD